MELTPLNFDEPGNTLTPLQFDDQSTDMRGRSPEDELRRQAKLAGQPGKLPGQSDEDYGKYIAHQAGYAPQKEVPGFMDKLKLIGDGTVAGASHFALGLANVLPLGKGYKKAINTASQALDQMQEFNKAQYESNLPGVSEFAGEMAATAPIGGVFGQLSKGAKYVGESIKGSKLLGSTESGASALASTLGKSAQYGTAGIGGAGILAGQESLRYDPNNPDQAFNTSAASEALQNPLSYALPMVGTKLESWLGKAQRLDEAKQVIPKIMSRQVEPQGPLSPLKNNFLDSFSNITDTGKQIQLDKNLGADVSNYIAKTANSPEVLFAKDYKEIAGQEMTKSLNKLNKLEDSIWDQPFKTKPVNDVEGIKVEASNILDIISNVKTAVPKATLTEKLVKDISNKNTFTVDETKQLYSTAGRLYSELKDNNQSGLANPILSKLQDIRENLMDSIQNSLSPQDLKDFSTARTFSAKKFSFLDNSPKIQKALNSELDSRKLIADLISEAEVTDKQKIIGLMNADGRKAASAAKLSSALEGSTTNGRLNIDSFLKKTSEASLTPDILGNKSYQSLQGLRKYLQGINESKGSSFSKILAGANLVSLGLPVLIANHSPLKTLFAAMNRNVPGATFENMSKLVTKHLTRAGYFMQDDGSMIHKSEDTNE